MIRIKPGKMIKTLIIEDEYPAAERLTSLLERAGYPVEILAVITSIKDALIWFSTHEQPDLIFSDIQLADGLSFEIYQAINIQSPIIFTTAYDEYAIRAFKVKSIDYLLKPIKQTELNTAIGQYEAMKESFAGGDSKQRLEALLNTFVPQKSYKNRLLVASRKSMIPVLMEEVAYFFTANEIVYLIHRDGSKYTVDQTLDSLVGDLDPSLFFRLNRQYIANLNAIRKVHNFFNGKLKLDLNPATDDDVIVSRDKAKAFKAWLGG